MRATGMVRRIDNLGRVVLPKEMRSHFGLENGTPLEIFFTDEGILLKKYVAAEEFQFQLNELNTAFDMIRDEFDFKKSEMIAGHIQELIRIFQEKNV